MLCCSFHFQLDYQFFWVLQLFYHHNCIAIFCWQYDDFGITLQGFDSYSFSFLWCLGVFFKYLSYFTSQIVSLSIREPQSCLFNCGYDGCYKFEIFFLALLPDWYLSGICWCWQQFSQVDHGLFKCSFCIWCALIISDVWFF